MGTEISNPIAADRAFGKHISGCLWQSRLTTLQEFNNRATRDKIYYGDNQNPELFLENLAKSTADKPQLPIVCYFRDLDFWMDPDDCEPGVFELSNTEGTSHNHLEYATYCVRYSILVVGRGSANINEVAISLHH